MCDFCTSGKPVRCDFLGGKKVSGAFIFGELSSDPNDYDPEDLVDFDDSIVLIGNHLFWDNSSGEYSMQGVKIRYCPFCGNEVKAVEEV